MAVPYVRDLNISTSARLISNIAQSYIKARLEYIKVYVQNEISGIETSDLTDLFPRDQLEQSMEQFRYLVRFDYDAGCNMIRQEIDPRIEAYKNITAIRTRDEAFL